VHGLHATTSKVVNSAQGLSCKLKFVHGVSETNLKLKVPCSKCMHRPVMSWGNACSTCMHWPVTSMHWPVMSQADACTYCMGSKVLSLSRIYSSYFEDCLVCPWQLV
jgi:hypothetical protein